MSRRREETFIWTLEFSLDQSVRLEEQSEKGLSIIDIELEVVKYHSSLAHSLSHVTQHSHDALIIKPHTLLLITSFVFAIFLTLFVYHPCRRGWEQACLLISFLLHWSVDTYLFSCFVFLLLTGAQRIASCITWKNTGDIFIGFLSRSRDIEIFSVWVLWLRVPAWWSSSVW